ncbi:hypothetical protein BX600DRAFT_7999 [Xylariales sp. PMI_506]|nr:hypothetical protein BX600DRAFT_7999 [Xylariales sp. PMI_506]
MGWQAVLDVLGSEVDDPDEEVFLLFSRDIPSQNLGFVDSRASTLELNVAGKDYVIHQSPAVLSSNRAGGTTGAVLWKVTPLFADWIAGPENPLWKTGALSSTSAVIELGCGISGLTGLVLGPLISRYVLTDQSYVSKFVESNLAENASSTNPTGRGARRKGKGAAAAAAATASQKFSLGFTALDWELDEVTPSLTGSDAVKSFDAVLACDCIYNDALIRPLVQTCVDVCRLRGSAANVGGAPGPTICIVAQQLRDPEIFEGWLKEFYTYFRTWRVPDLALTETLRSSPGFVIHVGILRDQDRSSE